MTITVLGFNLAKGDCLPKSGRSGAQIGSESARRDGPNAPNGASGGGNVRKNGRRRDCECTGRLSPRENALPSG
jgi:hypothetical protein